MRAPSFACASNGCVAEEEEEVAESAEAITNGRIVVRFGAPGPTTGNWGYDLKQEGRSKAMKPALAKELFEDIGMPLVRVAVRASDGHPERGVEKIDRRAYADDLDAIAMAKNARKDLEVFASLKLLGGETFPAWVKDGGVVNAEKYAVLLTNYLAFMKAEGVTVDWLGVDNERKFNHGGITPAKYNEIVRDVTAWCKDRGVKVPGFIAPEDYGPVEDIGWLQDLWQTPAKYDRVDKIGVHIYSKHRDAAYVAAMERLATITRGKRLWDSELHWNDLDKDGDVRWDDIRKGMLTTFDHFDLGYQSMTWWAFQPRSRGRKGRLRHVGARRIHGVCADPPDGRRRREVRRRPQAQLASVQDGRTGGRPLGRELRQRGSEGPADGDRQSGDRVGGLRAVVADIGRRGEDRLCERREESRDVLDDLSGEHHHTASCSTTRPASRSASRRTSTRASASSSPASEKERHASCSTMSRCVSSERRPWFCLRDEGSKQSWPTASSRRSESHPRTRR